MTTPYPSIMVTLPLKKKGIALVGGSARNIHKLKVLVQGNLPVTVFSNRPSDLIIQAISDFTSITLESLSKLSDDPSNPTADFDIAFIGWETSHDQQDHKADHYYFDCLTNSIDNRKKSDFFMPAILFRGPLQIAISSAGAVPSLISRLRNELERIIPLSIGAFADYLTSNRSKLPSGQKQTQRRNLDELFADYAKVTSHDSFQPKKGMVALVGAGPGDPDLLTVRACQWLSIADVILKDRLVPVAVLSRARRDAEVIDVGKRSKRVLDAKHTPQEEIHQLMIDLALQGKIVCRLKGGDPMIFGRAGEEVQALLDQKIPFELVPGISSYQSASARSLSALTHRETALSLLVVTAHDLESGALNFDKLKFKDQTVAILMGSNTVGVISSKAIELGVPRNTQVALCFNVSQPNEVIRYCDLSNLQETRNQLVNQEHVSGPLIMLMGPSVQDRLNNEDYANLLQQPKLFELMHWLGKSRT